MLLGGIVVDDATGAVKFTRRFINKDISETAHARKICEKVVPIPPRFGPNSWHKPVQKKARNARKTDTARAPPAGPFASV